jgi:hypothetical protein
MHGFFLLFRSRKSESWTKCMVSAETVDDGKLKEAAKKKADESILIQIADKDLYQALASCFSMLGQLYTLLSVLHLCTVRRCFRSNVMIRFRLL